MSDLNDLTSEVTNIARDAAYVVVGLGVLGFQKAQVQRVELKSKLAGDLAVEDRLADLRTAVNTGIQQVDGIVEGALQFVETTLQPLEEQLPPVARDLAQKAHQQAREVRSQIRELVVPAS
ncbi:MAG: hypothetical protein ACYDHU_02735 [Acidimicrobiales bacterium]